VNAARLGAAITRSSGTSAASAAFSAATATAPNPAAAAAAGSTSGTGRILPSSPSSPIRTKSSRPAAGSVPDAARIATAMPRSKPLPRLGRLAGDRPTVILRVGHVSLLFTIAARATRGC
jgi:hypothetical protein